MQDQSPPVAPSPAASHDSGIPKNLENFLLTGWRPYAPGLPEPLAEAEAFRLRRRQLSALFPGETLVIPTGHEKVREIGRAHV